MGAWLRLPAVTLAAGVICVGLFLMMARMIANDAVASPPPDTTYTGLGEVEYLEEVNPTVREPFEEPELLQRPPVAGESENTRVTQQPQPAIIDRWQGPEGLNMGPGGLGGTGPISSLPDRTPFPAYPGRALQQGIQGYVVVALTIDARGRVVDAEIIEEKPSRVFDRAALAAVARWSIPSQAPQQGQKVIHRRLDFVLEE
jgi:protein TonB